MRKGSSDAGMSLVEVTIILMVLAILTSVLAPSIADYVNEARSTKAREDVEALGTGIMRLLRDVALPFPVRTAGASPSRASSNRVDLLVSEGNIPAVVAGTNTPASATNYVVSAFDWDTAVGTAVELATDHLVTNANAYSAVTFPQGGGPKPGIGWRGGYISSNTGPDPWGNRYACNTAWLNPGSDVTVAAFKGSNNDVYCLTAGGDGVAETRTYSDANGGITVIGDDVIYAFQGNTR